MEEVEILVGERINIYTKSSLSRMPILLSCFFSGFLEGLGYRLDQGLRDLIYMEGGALFKSPTI